MNMNPAKIKMILAALVIAAAALSTGCASTYTPPDYSQYYWPKEPLKTRLRLLNIIKTDLDIRQMTQGESLFGGSTFFRFKKPHSIVVDKSGNMYVTDTYARAVYVLNLENETIRQLKKPGGWTSPLGLGIDNENNILAISDRNTVTMMDYKTGQILRVLGPGEGFSVPQGIAFDPKNRYMYVVDTKGSAVYKYDYNGKRLATIASIGSGPRGVYYPAHAAVDSQGRLFVVDTMNWQIKIYDSDGEFIRAFGSHGSLPGQFNRPKGISVSKDGIIAITDNDLGFFMLMDEHGQTFTYMGGIGAKPAQFIVPQGIYISEDEKIYVVDQVNRRVQIFQMYSDRYYKEHPEPTPAALGLNTPAAEASGQEPGQATGEAPGGSKPQ